MTRQRSTSRPRHCPARPSRSPRRARARCSEGPRNGIGFSQLVPAVIQRLTGLITTKGKVRLGSISRFVLTNSLPGGNSGWNIYLTSGSTRFRALVLGDDPQIITPGGTHDLN
jgi:hypothetical protein